MTDARSTTQPTLSVVQYPVAYGRYFLVRKLAEGGMAEIFLAKQHGAEGFERNVVIKRMLPHLSQLPDFVSMFLDEARLAARLSHPNIVQIADLGKVDGTYYICMEYLAGEDFSSLVRTASQRMAYVPLEISLRVVAEAARGLHFAHDFTDENGQPLHIVHRDVSPSNIHVGYQGQVKVLDFGIAKAESRISRTTTGVVKGKYLYMSPEQARGAPVDRRSDVFSLGVSLYEALTRTRPFARDNDLAVLNAVLTQEYKKPRAVRPDLSPELEALILRAMAARPEERFQTAGELATAIEEQIAALGQPAGPSRVASYLRSLVPEERIISRTRIPSLAQLTPTAAEPAPVPEKAAEAPDSTARAEKTAATVAVRHARTPSSSEVRVPPRRSMLPWALAGLVALGSAGVAGWFVFHARTAHAPTTAGPAAPSTSTIAQGSPMTPAAARSGEKPAPSTPATDAARAAASEKVAPKPEPHRHHTHLRRERSVALTGAVIERVLAHHSTEILGCFRAHRAELTGRSAVIPVRFTILGSGRVRKAEAQGALAGSPVAHCLERAAKRIRFPKNPAQATTFIAPFQLSISK